MSDQYRLRGEIQSSTPGVSWQVYECPTCGAAVIDLYGHSDWHARLGQ